MLQTSTQQRVMRRMERQGAGGCKGEMRGVGETKEGEKAAKKTTMVTSNHCTAKFPLHSLFALTGPYATLNI